ncbi:MAG: acetyl-CoA C-acyltransferase [Gammaproteobacteria bacterium]|nr:acetyl-CoA C-acyltransferase [Gammaproteobacteria bacterium]
MNDDDIVIVSAKRTPTGAFQGAFSSSSSTDLGAAAIKGLIVDSKIDINLIDEVLMGCVLPAGLGQAPARQAALKANLSLATACTTVNKVCGSGMKTVMMAHDLIKAGSANIVVSGGMESMTNAPYLLPKVRDGLRLGHSQVIDHMFFDGLENAGDNALMGTFAENCADKYSFTREQQDAFATESVTRAITAIKSRGFIREIAPVETKTRDGKITVDQDEPPLKCKIDKIPRLKPAFRKDTGTVTAANSSSIADGAAALLIMQAHKAKSLGLTPLAKIVAHSSHAQEPENFTTAPVGAIKKLLEKTGWTINNVDLFEINEAFAVVTMAAIKELELDHNKVNIHGGACALGHPIGASGARLLVTLVHALQKKQLTRGIASLCIGGGEATAVAIERV